jgi:uncharacterized protein (TIGR02147 family)
MITPTIYQYDTFRTYLKDLFEERKAAEPGYSYRRFAADAGFSNPGFLVDVIKGRRTLSADAVEKVIVGFGLSSREGEFFRLLVKVSRTRDEQERRELLHELNVRRNRSRFVRLNRAFVKYYQDYHYPLVRNGVEAFGFDGDYEAFARFFDPSLAVSDLKKYVRDLCEWGLVEQDTAGRYRVTDMLVEPPETLGLQVREMNAEWIRHALGALRRIPPSERHISSMLLGVSRENRRRILERIEEFRSEIAEMVEHDDNPEVVMQLGMQWFPKSKVKR